MRYDKKPLIVALAGNPNSGKTTLFNNLTGANQHVGNYPGVTVEKKEGILNFKGHQIKLIDLPGTYSLSAYSIEEVITRNYIIEEKPDVVVNIVDASNIERNLYLTTQLLELGVPVVIALNMSDMARNRGIITDKKLLGQLLGVTVVATVGHKRKGMDKLLQAAIDTINNVRGYNPSQVNYGKEFEEDLVRLTEAIEKSGQLSADYQPRWIALKLLEEDHEVDNLVRKMESSDEIFSLAEEGRERIKKILGEDPSQVISDCRYGFISGACSEAIRLVGEHRHDISDKIDLALIHPVLGLPIFGFLMWLMFNLTFTLGEKPMEWIESGIGLLTDFLTANLPEGMITSLIVDGIIGGVGGVFFFLPHIFFLFFSLSLFLDSRYLAPAAFFFVWVFP